MTERKPRKQTRRWIVTFDVDLQEGHNKETALTELFPAIRGFTGKVLTKTFNVRMKPRKPLKD